MLDLWLETPSANPAVSTNDLVVIDADAAKGGLEAAAQLPLIDTLTVRTTSGGRHYYFRPPPGERFQSRAYRRLPDGREIFAIDGAPGVDVRAAGGLVIGPGAVVNGRPYVIERDVPVAPLPPALAERLRKAPERVAEPIRIVGELDTPGAIERAVTYLQADAPVAIEGIGGDDTTYSVCCRVMDFGVSRHRTIELMLEHWNERCQPPWDIDDLEKKAASAEKNRQSPIGRDNPDNTHFEVATPISDGSSASPSIADGSPLSATAIDFHPATRWIGKVPQKSRFVIGKIVPEGYVTLLTGRGGTGKSLVAQTMMTCVAAGRPFLGLEIMSGDAAGIFCEDDDDELHRRQLRICRELDVELGSVGGRLRPLSLVGESLTLHDGQRALPALMALEAAIRALPNLKLVVLDNASQIYSGSEIERAAVTRFIKQLSILAHEHQIAIVLISHESQNSSKENENDATGASGSTAWTNACRSSLRLVATERGLELRNPKNNRGPKADPIACEIRNGALVPAETSPARDVECLQFTEQMLRKAFEEGANLSPNNRAQNYAARVFFKAQPDPGSGFHLSEIEGALGRLNGFAIDVETYQSRGGKISKRFAPMRCVSPSSSSPLPDPSSSSPVGE